MRVISRRFSEAIFDTTSGANSENLQMDKVIAEYKEPEVALDGASKTEDNITR